MISGWLPSLRESKRWCGATAADPVPWSGLSRDQSRELSSGSVRQRGSGEGFRGHAGRDMQAVPLAASCVCDHAKPFPPRGRNGGAEPRRWHAPVAKHVCDSVQSAAVRARSSVSGTLSVVACGGGERARASRELHPPQAVRASIITAEQVGAFRWSSLARYLKCGRPEWFAAGEWLEGPGVD